jgi:Concanavalin A-like lectin/glucanases superfamily
MKIASNQAALWATAFGLGLASACSLGVPTEDELFGSAGSGGKETVAGSNSGGKSGAAPTEQGGEPTANGGAFDVGGGGGADSPPGGAGGAPQGGQPPVGSGAGGQAGEPGVVELPKAVLFLHYTFDDVSELIAEDVSGNERHGTLAGTSLPVGDVGKLDGALKLTGSLKQYVHLPNDVLDGKPAVSIASWVKLGQALAWDRLFDFNSGESNWFFFSPTGWNSTSMTFGTRCATRTTGVLAPEIMLSETVSIDTWHHVTIVFAKPYLRYYLDGKLKSQIDDMSFDTAALGKTNQNWIGRSVYATDPYLTGWVDDFRMYVGALTDAEVNELYEL